MFKTSHCVTSRVHEVWRSHKSQNYEENKTNKRFKSQNLPMGCSELLTGLLVYELPVVTDQFGEKAAFKTEILLLNLCF